MILSPADAQRLARLLALQLATFEWNRREGETYLRFDFRLVLSGSKVQVTRLPASVTDPSAQAAKLSPDEFSAWFDQQLVTEYLAEADLAVWLLKEAPRFEQKDVEASLQSFAHIDFAVPFSYRYDWDGMLQLAGVLQTGAVLEDATLLFLKEAWRQTKIRIAWRPENQSYSIRLVEENAPESSEPGLDEEQLCDIEGLGEFFKEHYNHYKACDWLAWMRNHQTPASDEATVRLRTQYAAPLTEKDCVELLERVRTGKALRLARGASPGEETTLLWEDGKYLKRHLYEGEVTGVGGQTLYEGTMGDTTELSEQDAIRALQSHISYRHRIDSVWVD